MRNKRLITTLSALVFLSLACASHAGAENLSAYQIVKKSEALMDQAKDTRSEMVMTLIDKKGAKRERKLLSYAKRSENGDKKALLFFETPADVKGTSFLMWSITGKEDQQWLYLPALQRVRQVSSTSKGDSFMGTEFSFYDMGTRNLDAYTYKLLREEPVEGLPCYVIETIPKKVEFYTKVITWFRKDNFLPVKMDFYDTKGQYLKQGTMSKVVTIKDIKTPTHIEMKNIQNGRTTIIELNNIQYDTSLTDDIFTQRYMQRGK